MIIDNLTTDVLGAVNLHGLCDKIERSGNVKMLNKVSSNIMENQSRQMFNDVILDNSNPFTIVEIIDCLDKLDMLERVG
jgi:hypothetical protein